MKIYFAGEGYAHDYKNQHKMGMRKRLFSYYEKSRMINCMKKLKIKQ